MHQWQLQEAKARLSELIKKACTDGPQQITVHGESRVVILSQKTYNKIIYQKQNFVDFMLNSPLHGANIKIERDKTTGRNDTLL